MKGSTSTKPFRVAALRSKQLVPHYLMACYLYYERDISAITDAEFDKLARRLGAEWVDARHRHRGFLQRSALGSGYHLTGQLPGLVKGAAMQWAIERGVYKPDALLSPRRPRKIAAKR